ncbi:hypothetical protein ZTR_10337 [Talaromyces verruculosus]|nr:hypothetical protein ZTR_10337 [Talaromyces verruculosus]
MGNGKIDEGLLGGLWSDARSQGLSKEDLAMFLRELQSQTGTFEVQANLLRRLADEENKLKGFGGGGKLRDHLVNQNGRKPITREASIKLQKSPEEEFNKLKEDICEMLRMLF